ncbi:MAG: c-type cytochrome, partial [Planctomycetaceae bacterium]|nr:c-type cytochrome [Planctomycetaceae bacterium]
KSEEGLESVVRLLKAAPDQKSRETLWESVFLGWQEQPRGTPEDEKRWTKLVQNHKLTNLFLVDWLEIQSDVTLRVGIALKQDGPFFQAASEAFDIGTSAERRVTLLNILAPSGRTSLIDETLDLVENNSSEKVRIAGLQVLGHFDDPQIAARLIKLHQSTESESLKSQIRDVLLGRAGSARAWVEAVERKEIPASVTPLEQIRRVALLGDEELDSLVTKHWGKLQGVSREEKLAEVRRLNNDVRAALGNPKLGKDLFKKHCAGCHQLFGEGAKVGPDLTTANRQDRDFLLVSLVDPSSVIRKEYVSAVIVTRSGRVVTGLPIARDDSSITLVDSKSEKLVLPMSEVEELNESPVSLMPDDLYRQFKPQELRDLFAYLQSQK